MSPWLGKRIAAVLLAAAVILGGAYLWLRDSSLVAVQRVKVVGVSGPDAAQIRAALRTAALSMTTLDVKSDQLRTAVQPFPVVKHLEVSTEFPHGLRITVIEQVPVATVTAGGRRFAVSGDGTLLHDVAASPALPTIALAVPPGGARLVGPALSEVRLLASAPYALLARIGQVSDGSAHGLVASLRAGPSIYFGAPSELGAKWSAATAVLGSSSSNGAVYVDVTDPRRPAAGAGPDRSASLSGASSGPGAAVAAGAGTGASPSAGAGASSPGAGASGGVGGAGSTSAGG